MDRRWREGSVAAFYGDLRWQKARDPRFRDACRSVHGPQRTPGAPCASSGTCSPVNDTFLSVPGGFPYRAPVVLVVDGKTRRWAERREEWVKPVGNGLGDHGAYRMVVDPLEQPALEGPA